MSVRNMMINRLIGGHCSSRKHVVLCGNAVRSLMTARKRDQAIYPMRTSNTALLVCDMQEVFRSRIYGMDSVILNSTTLTNVANVLDLRTIVTEQYPEKLKHTIPEISDVLGERSVVFPKTKFSMYTSDVIRKLDRWGTVKYDNPLENTLFVGNLNFDVTEQMLRDMFEKNYSVQSAEVMYTFDENGNRTTNSKGYGLVTLDRTEELKHAISEFHGTKCFGRNLIVREDGGSRKLASERDTENEVDKVILCGIETHVCILQTCVDLRRNNFDVYLPVDAIGSQRPEDHETAIRRLEREGVKLTTTESVVFELVKDSKHENFKEISSLIKDRAELIKTLEASYDTSSSSSYSSSSDSRKESSMGAQEEENMDSKVLNALFGTKQ